MRNGFCPACFQPVSLPELAPDTLVRCPACRAEFPMVEFAQAAPPAVEVVVEPVRSQDPMAGDVQRTPVRGGRAVGPESATGSGTAADAGTGGQQFDFGERLPSPAEMAPLILSAGKHAPQRRSGVGGAVKVVLGGLLGAVLAQLIVWWLPHPYRTDPFELAPRLPDQLKWIAPLELQFQGLGQLDDGAGEEVAADWEPKRDEPQVIPQAEPPAGTVAESSGVKNTDSNRPLGPQLRQRFLVEEIEAAVRDAVAATSRLYRSQNAGQTVSTEEWSRSLDQVALRLAAAEPQNGDNGTQLAAVEKLIRSIEKQPKLKTALDQHVLSSWRRPQELSGTGTPAEDSDAATSAKSDVAPPVNAAEASGGKSGGKSGQPSSDGAGEQFQESSGRIPVGKSSGTLQGGWVAGRVDSIGPRGAYFESMVRISSSLPPVAVLSLADPSQSSTHAIGVGDQVVVGGLTLVHPAAELSSYDGPDRPVLWASITIPITPNTTSPSTTSPSTTSPAPTQPSAASAVSSQPAPAPTSSVQPAESPKSERPR